MKKNIALILSLIMFLSPCIPISLRASSWGEWTGWTENYLEGSANMQVETKTQYRYSDKQTTTSTSSSLSGWTQSGSSTSYGSWGSWSKWDRGSKASSDTVNVQTSTVYGYYYFRCPNCGAHMHVYTSCYTWAGGCGKSNMSLSNAVNIFDPTPWSSANCYEFHGTGKYATDSLTAYGRLFQWSDNGVNSWAGYRYRTRSKTVTYSFYKWGDWSAWSDTVYSSGSSRKVQTRTLYRSRNLISSPSETVPSSSSTTEPSSSDNTKNASDYSLSKRGIILSISSPHAKTVKIKWKKYSGISGYQCYISLNKGFKKFTVERFYKKNKSKIKIKNLRSRKTYYFKIRPYKKVNGTKIFGKWSSTKKVKIK